MPSNKSPELIKIEALASAGNQVNSALNTLRRVNDLLTNGKKANAQQGEPALTADEIAAVVGAENTAAIKAAYAASVADKAP